MCEIFFIDQFNKLLRVYMICPLVTSFLPIHSEILFEFPQPN